MYKVGLPQGRCSDLQTGILLQGKKVGITEGFTKISIAPFRDGQLYIQVSLTYFYTVFGCHVKAVKKGVFRIRNFVGWLVDY
jgi:hypothetical protein